MDRTIFSQHYRIDTDPSGTPLPFSRSGAAINYKATDTRTGSPVMLQLLSRSAVDRASAEQVEERARASQKIDHVNVARVLDVVLEDDYIGLISEDVEGETVESWLVAHGPMPADAVLRVAVQVVRGVAAAAFFGLTHRAIQPSNIMIVSGQTLEGGWPFVKLLNFGLAGLEIYTSGAEARELASATAPQFASPEQLLNKPIDFRSEMYSLGATMCFLLTGAVPLAVGGMKARLRARRLPELRRAPRALRNLLVHMLRENPENRPQDPVAFETEIRNCLARVERRQALGRKLGLPLAAVTPGRAARKARVDVTPARQVGRGILAFAALILIGAVAAAFLLPEDVLPFHRRTAENIGVPVGVPSPVVAAATNDQSPLPAPVVSANNQPPPVNSSSPVVAQQTPAVAEQRIAQEQAGASPAPASAESDTNQPAPTNNTFANVNANSPSNDTTAQSSQPAARVAAANSASQANAAPPPAEGPVETAGATADRSAEPAAADDRVAASSSESAGSSGQSADANKSDRDADNSDAGPTHTKKKTLEKSASSVARRGSNPGSIATSRSVRSRPGEVHARFVGTTSDGRMIMRLPSGRTVIITPGAPDRDVGATQPRRRIIERREIVVPYQPFDPGNPHD
jgi:serine/threonine protein kinase